MWVGGKCRQAMKVKQAKTNTRQLERLKVKSSHSNEQARHISCWRLQNYLTAQFQTLPFTPSHIQQTAIFSTSAHIFISVINTICTYHQGCECLMMIKEESIFNDVAGGRRATLLLFFNFQNLNVQRCISSCSVAVM